jgi:hypothetical protein
MIVVFLGEHEFTVEFDSKVDALAYVDGKMLQYSLHLGADGLILEAVPESALNDREVIGAAEWGEHPDFNVEEAEEA